MKDITISRFLCCLMATEFTVVALVFLVLSFKADPIFHGVGAILMAIVAAVFLIPVTE